MEQNKPEEFKFELEKINFKAVSIPQFVEKVNQQRKIVQFGADNLFPQYLQSLLVKSSLHSSIVYSKARMIGGNGFLKTNLNLKTMLFLRNSRGNYDLDTILYRVSEDLEVYGGFALNIIWSKDRDSISEINYVDVAKLRVQAPDPKHKYPQIDNYLISDGWENILKWPPTTYQGFSTRSKGKRSQMLYVKAYKSGTEYYARAEYLAGIRDMETDWLIGDWHCNAISKGFTPGFIITLPFMQGTAEQRQSVARRLKDDLEGTPGANAWFVQWANQMDKAPIFDPIEPNSSDDRFLQLDEKIERSILKAHSVKNPKLYGAGRDGGIDIGTTKNEMLEAIEIFQVDYATPKQNILEKIFNRLARINGVTDNLIIKRYSENYRKIDTNLQDVMSVLTSTLGKDQQYWVLVQNGYTHEVASKLTQYDGGVSIADVVKPQAGPVLNSENFEKVWNELKYMQVERDLNYYDFEDYVEDYIGKKNPEYMEFSKVNNFTFNQVPIPDWDNNSILDETDYLDHK